MDWPSNLLGRCPVGYCLGGWFGWQSAPRVKMPVVCHLSPSNAKLAKQPLWHLLHFLCFNGYSSELDCKDTGGMMGLLSPLAKSKPSGSTSKCCSAQLCSWAILIILCTLGYIEHQGELSYVNWFWKRDVANCGFKVNTGTSNCDLLILCLIFCVSCKKLS